MTEGARESLEQLITAWRSIALDREPGADVRNLPGIALHWADCRALFWNGLALTENGLDAELLGRRLHEAARIMRGKRNPGFLWLFEDFLTEGARAALGTVAARAGLEHEESGSGMAGVVLPMPEPRHPELTFVRVRTADQVRAYADLNSRAYGFPVEHYRDGLTASALWTGRAHAYLGVREGVPVSCAAAIPTAGRLFVNLVATDPRWQRRGYGEAVTRKALHAGHRESGLTRATLHATLAGQTVYERIGLAPNSPIHLYILAN
ncbi:GNAT family N-acetyltransferase [Sciscionella sediminilitoris]|uniref:GNAT family N-acetyltransferase n=1 Tax=Sciscionella sediminilitoris TaxID=1445613 RepID=UPI0004DFA5E2|nr:GNAT family N-acetyltransferase [Sciscionella sp. SE31]